MKKEFLSIGLVAGAMLLFSLTSCKKETCLECDYEVGTTVVELGEKCGDEIEKIEASGYAVDGKIYEVHCGAH